MTDEPREDRHSPEDSPVDQTPGCGCVVCLTSRANHRQSQRIKELQEALDEAVKASNRVRILCESTYGVVRVKRVLKALDGVDLATE